MLWLELSEVWKSKPDDVGDGVMKDAGKLYYGNRRIKCFWSLTHTVDWKSGYLGLHCFSFDQWHSPIKTTVLVPPVLGIKTQFLSYLN